MLWPESEAEATVHASGTIALETPAAPHSMLGGKGREDLDALIDAMLRGDSESAT